MNIYIYVDEFNTIIDWHKNIDCFKKKYDSILCCQSTYYNTNYLGKKTILKNIKELGYCCLRYKDDFKQAGFLQKIKEGTDERY
jgi:hypothetical protein